MRTNEAYARIHREKTIVAEITDSNKILRKDNLSKSNEIYALTERLNNIETTVLYMMGFEYNMEESIATTFVTLETLHEAVKVSLEISDEAAETIIINGKLDGAYISPYRAQMLLKWGRRVL